MGDALSSPTVYKVELCAFVRTELGEQPLLLSVCVIISTSTVTLYVWLFMNLNTCCEIMPFVETIK